MDKVAFMSRVHRMDYGDYREAQLGLLFDISKLSHEADDPRANGEPYHEHPIAVALGSMDTQEALGIRDWRATGGSLIHDSGESLAENITHLTRNLMRLTQGFSMVDPLIILIGRELTKSSIPSLRKLYFETMSYTRSVSVIWVKFEDRIHNAKTFHKLEESFDRKVEETIQKFPILARRAVHLIEEERRQGRLLEPGWLLLPRYLFDKLNASLEQYGKQMVWLEP